MKKYILFLSGCCLIASQTKAEDWANSYQDFKKKLQTETGLSYSLDASFLPQRANPNVAQTAWQSQYYGTINWDLFDNQLGQGSFQVAYTAVRYWGITAEKLSDKIGVISPINDYPSNTNNFDQLSYTHVLPGKLSDFSITLGQFPMYNFDGGDYNANQQINFLNFALSQNASSVYPTASLGGFITYTPNNQFSFAVGMQDANNISGETISSHDFSKGNYTTFASITWNPVFFRQPGQYSILIYNQPSVDSQAVHTQGWSVNLQQNLTPKVALFGRLNGTNKNQNTITQSYVLGSVVNNPLDRNPLDQIGMAMAFNKLNKKTNGAQSRSWEQVLEGYWAIGISNFLTITPDIQFYFNPGADKNNKNATVISLRATLMF